MVAFQVEKLGENCGHCDCCGNDNHAVWGFVHDGPRTVAAYWMRWTEGHLSDLGADLDLVIGSWGDGTSETDRTSISLWHKDGEDGAPALMVVDAEAKEGLSASGLKRDEVVGTPLAQSLFAMVDAIYEQDDRFF